MRSVRDRTNVPIAAAHLTFQGAKYLILVVAVVLAGYPILWLVFGSLKGAGELYTNFWLPPARIEVENYTEAWAHGNIGRNLLNSVIVSVGSVAVVLIIAIPAGYAFARLRLPGKAWILSGCVLTLMVQPTFVMVGLFRLFSTTGMLNTYHGLILVYAAGSLPLALALFTAYIQAIPRDIDESALLDGAGHWRILRSIVVPLIGPVTSAVIIFTFLNSYNDLILALTLWNRYDMETLSVGLAGLISDRRLDYPQLFAGTAASLIPVVLVYLVFQRRFVNSFISGTSPR